MKMPDCLWVCSVGRSCSVSVNLGAEGGSLGEMHRILGLTDNINTLAAPENLRS